ncbi:Probable gamma-secretase subunit PEN-2 [Prunus dulcis]|uniref:Probable gamma-secretase subunit PEN-2 n=1 Tax=Prunus dulcis TaxID=3755 RepID=A0A4Y1RER1_PRUDU|nr:Probable gamma-secretase subunit PEN-2 [Prunus dulcis]
MGPSTASTSGPLSAIPAPSLAFTTMF